MHFGRENRPFFEIVKSQCADRVIRAYTGVTQTNSVKVLSGAVGDVSEQTEILSRPASLAERPENEPKDTDAPQKAEPDPDQLHQLVVEHSDSVFRLARSIVRDKALAEDITQETMVKAWLALPSFRGESSLKGWVLRIAHNTAISVIRSRRSVVVDPADLVEVDLTTSDTVERSVENKEAYSDFIEALDLLDDLSKSILILREVEGLSYEEISKVLRVPLPTVKTRLLRSRRRMGLALKEWSG